MKTSADLLRVKPTLSFIVSVSDSGAGAAALFKRISESAMPLCSSFEVIFVDDCSRDDSWKKLVELHQAHPFQVKALRLSPAMGDHGAKGAGWDESNGNFVFTLSSDQQDRTEEIENFLLKMNEGFDVAIGIRPNSGKIPLGRRLLKGIVEDLIGGVSQAATGFNCYRRDAIKDFSSFDPLRRKGASPHGQDSPCRMVELPLSPVDTAADSGATGTPGLMQSLFGNSRRNAAGNHSVSRVVERLVATAPAKGLRRFVTPGSGDISADSGNLILVVDDDPVSANTAAHHLTKAGCLVRIAGSCAAAREELKRFPDLVLLDLYLPDGDGLSLLKEIRQMPDAPKVVLLSAETDIQAGVEAMRLGAADYICKPTQPVQLLAVIRRALESSNPVSA